MKYLLPLLTVLMLLTLSLEAVPKVLVGADVLFDADHINFIRGKKIGLVTNHTAINSQLTPTYVVIKSQAKIHGYTLVAMFGPEHGIKGANHAEKLLEHEVDPDGIPIYSLHGKTFRPTEEMLKGINLLIFDIQDIGSRSYTYISTLFYVMEEAAKHHIPILVLDRPNPINGIVVDGPMLKDNWRSIVGYINVPYCHGMTIGELAKFFNAEYKIGCDLKVIPMKGWHRRMSFQDTGLAWIPTSPHIPEANTPFYYPITGILGELQIISIGVGYTLPFKVIGAPWIDAEVFAKNLNAQKLAGIAFLPFHFCPFYGRFAKENCQGVQIVVTNPLTYKPVAAQYIIIGVLKQLYPEKMKSAIEGAKHRKDMFAKVNGTDEVYQIMTGAGPIIWKLRSLHHEERETFKKTRKKYLLPNYQE